MGWQKQQPEYAFWRQGQRPVGWQKLSMGWQKQQLEYAFWRQGQRPVGSRRQRQQLEHALEQRQTREKQQVVVNSC